MPDLIGEFNIDFSKRDFLSILEQADALAESLVPEWTTRDDNDINWATIKIVSYFVSIAHMYIDLGINERDPFEAQIRENALKNARQYGFPVRLSAGGIGNANLTIPVQGSTTTVARGETCFDDNGNTFVILEDVVYPTGDTVKPASLQFGEFERFAIGVSDGSEFQQFKVDRDRVQDKAARAFIDEGTGFEEWEVRDSLLMSKDTDKHLRLILDSDDKYIIAFGDDKSGKVPANLADIEVEILTLPINAADEGVNFGNIPPNNLTSCSDALVESIDQSVAFTGGGVGQTVKEIGRALPQWVSTANRAVATDDYVFLARQVGGVADASVNQDGITVDVFIIPVGGGLATSALQDKVRAFLLPRTLPNINLNVFIPTPIGIDAAADVVVEDDKDQAEIKSRAEDALNEFLEQPTTVGRTVDLNDAYDVVNAVVGVKRVKITALHKTGGPIVADHVLLIFSEVSVAGTIAVTATGGIS